MELMRSRRLRIVHVQFLPQDGVGVLTEENMGTAYGRTRKSISRTISTGCVSPRLPSRRQRHPYLGLRAVYTLAAAAGRIPFLFFTFAARQS